MATLREWLIGDGLDQSMVTKYRNRYQKPDGVDWLRRHGFLEYKDEIDEAIKASNSLPPRIIPDRPKSKAPIIRAKGVGSHLHEILIECGINPPCFTCTSFAARMDGWGIEGCEGNHRKEIIDHLDAEAKKASWLDWIKVGAKGYLSSEALLEEAIKRAKQEAKPDKLGESQ